MYTIFNIVYLQACKMDDLKTLYLLANSFRWGEDAWHSSPQNWTLILWEACNTYIVWLPTGSLALPSFLEVLCRTRRKSGVLSQPAVVDVCQMSHRRDIGAYLAGGWMGVKDHWTSGLKFPPPPKKKRVILQVLKYLSATTILALIEWFVMRAKQCR